MGGAGCSTSGSGVHRPEKLTALDDHLKAEVRLDTDLGNTIRGNAKQCGSLVALLGHFS